MYYNSNTLMSKYLVNSTMKPEINGYYINTGNEIMNGQLVYKKDDDSRYRLYYDNIESTWNIGLHSQMPLVSAHQGDDISDPYKAYWNMVIIVKFCIICNSNSNSNPCCQKNYNSNSTTTMSKYLVNSTMKPEIDGYYSNTGNEMVNGQLVYKKVHDSRYRLYYDNFKLTWNIGLQSETPLVVAHQGVDISDPYKANWNMVVIIVKLCVICNTNSNLCCHEDYRPSPKPKAQNYLLQSPTYNKNIINNRKCDVCSLYVCCCNIDNQYIIEEEDCRQDYNKNVLVCNSGVLDSKTKVFSIKDDFGWYTICSGIETTWGEFRLEYSSGNNNRYGYINFTLNKNVYSKEMVLNILSQRQYYNDNVELCLEKEKYVVFTDLRVATDINCVSYIQVKYNKSAYKNGDIMAQISLKEKYESQWKLVEFIGPNADTKYACLEPSVSVDVIEAKVFADKKYILNTDGNLGLNVAEPKRTIDVKGQIKTSSNNNYNSSNLNDGDLVIYDDKSFENYFIQNSDNFNQHTYTRFKFLSPVQLKYNSNILRHNSNGAQPLIIPEVGLGDSILFMFKDVNNQNNIEFLVKQIIGCDTDGQLIMESEILETDISTIIANPLVDLFLIKKDGFTNKTLSVNLGNNKILEGSEMKFTKKFVEGDKIIILFQDDVITRRIQKVKNDLQIELTKSILSTKPILGFIPVPAQFIIQNNEGKTNIMVDDSGSLIFASNDSDLEINAIEMSVEKGKMEILSSTVNSITNQPGIDNYSLDGNFLKLQGNLKIEGQSKFTNDLFICTNQPGLSEPDITALIDSNKGDLRLKGSMVSKRVVANNATMVQLQVNNLLSKTHSTWSDRRLKKDIETVKETNIIEKLSKLNPVKFKWRENETQDMGFIAQEIKEIFPDAVEEHEDGFLHIHYNRLLAYMVMGMKQMNENK